MRTQSRNVQKSCIPLSNHPKLSRHSLLVHASTYKQSRILHDSGSRHETGGSPHVAMLSSAPKLKERLIAYRHHHTSVIHLPYGWADLRLSGAYGRYAPTRPARLSSHHRAARSQLSFRQPFEGFLAAPREFYRTFLISVDQPSIPSPLLPTSMFNVAASMPFVPSMN